MDYLTLKPMGNQRTSEVSNWENQQMGESPQLDHPITAVGLGPLHCGMSSTGG